MRQFIEDKCDIADMFPDLTNDNERVSKHWFYEYERIIEDILDKKGKRETDTFTKDEVIDFFIQGTSIAHIMLAIKYDNSICNFEEMKKIKEWFDKRNDGSSKAEQV